MQKWERDEEQMRQLIGSFEDTWRMCKYNMHMPDSKSFRLQGSVSHSKGRQQIILDDMPIQGLCRAGRHGRVSVTLNKTLQAAAAYKGKKIAVLNFGSPFAPGGPGHKSTLTQEECLCRESTLWSCISATECIDNFYSRHEQNQSNWLGNADMIYTPGVTVFKSYDKIPVMMDMSDWFNVDVITMAAPLTCWAGKDKRLDTEMIAVFERRFMRMIQKAAVEEVDVLILGAFGCGAFGNNPAIVATAAARAIDETKCLETFENIEFACYDTGKKKNYRMFRIVLDRYLNASV